MSVAKLPDRADQLEARLDGLEQLFEELVGELRPPLRPPLLRLAEPVVEQAALTSTPPGTDSDG